MKTKQILTLQYTKFFFFWLRVEMRVGLVSGTAVLLRVLLTGPSFLLLSATTAGVASFALLRAALAGLALAGLVVVFCVTLGAIRKEAA